LGYVAIQSVWGKGTRVSVGWNLGLIPEVRLGRSFRRNTRTEVKFDAA
jgi:hypothetical protein